MNQIHPLTRDNRFLTPKLDHDNRKQKMYQMKPKPNMNIKLSTDNWFLIIIFQPLTNSPITRRISDSVLVHWRSLPRFIAKNRTYWPDWKSDLDSIRSAELKLPEILRSWDSKLCPTLPTKPNSLVDYSFVVKLDARWRQEPGNKPLFTILYRSPPAIPLPYKEVVQW